MYIPEASGNDVARAILFSLGRQTLPLTRRVFERAANRDIWTNNWRNIVECIRSGNAVAARRAVHNLIKGINAGALVAPAELNAESKTTASMTSDKSNKLLLRGAETMGRGA